MAGRRYSLFWRNASRVLHTSRIVPFIVVGVLLGCVFAFLFPRGFTRHHPQINPRISVSNLQVIPSSVSESPKGKIRILKSTISSLTEENAALKEKLLDLENSRPPRAGPPGTVKNPRTNPLLHADESVNPRLSKILRNISGDRELIVTLANSNVMTMLGEWHENVKRLSIRNYVVVALDEGIADYCKSNGIHTYRRNPDESVDSVGRTGGNHEVSGLKFKILREFLQLGYSVLLSDVDVVYVRNPLEHLHRDCDVESMTDGHDNSTAYGYDDVFDDPAMGWSRYAHTMRIWVFNSGFFYMRPTAAAIELLDRVAARLAGNSQLWDQAVFNEELFYPSRPGYVGLHASRRAMDFFMFMNSKVLFGTVRKDARLRALTPAVVHVNYHPDKLARMKAVVDFYIAHNSRALDPFPDGSVSSVTA